MMVHHSDPPLRELLRNAITMRETTLRNNTCKRRDFGHIRATMAVAEAFLQHYPFATDQQVRQWCLKHDVSCIVPGNQHMLHWKLTKKPLEAPSTQVA